jgi:hypothetical protein
VAVGIKAFEPYVHGAFKMRFASTPLGEKYWKLYKDQYMRAFFIGFILLVGETQTMKDKSTHCHTKVELHSQNALPKNIK